jgi:hypothetical protein
MSDVSDWLSSNTGGAGGPSVYFGKVGDKVVGVISSKPRPVTVTDDKGNPASRLVVELVASGSSTAGKGKGGREDIGEGDELTLWVKPGLMATAISAAIEAAGAKGLTEGDTLAVQFSAEKDTGKIQPAKEYVAQLVPAKPTVAVGDLV